MIWLDVDTAIELFVNSDPILASADGTTIDDTIAFNESGMDLNWNFVTAAGVVSQVHVVPTAAGDYDWTLVGNGMYKIEMTASGGASVNNNAEGFGWFTGIADAVLTWRSPTYGFRAAGLNNLLVKSAFSANRGLTGLALPDAVAEAAGGLYTRGSGAGQINQDNNGQIDTDLQRIFGTALSEGGAGQLAAAFVKLFDVAVPTLVASDVMRGNDSANTTTPPTVNEVRDGILNDATRFSGGNINASISSRATPAQVNTQVSDVLKIDTIAERTQGVPPTTPTFEAALMYVYMALTREIDVDATLKEFYNNAGTVIWKKTLSDDGSNYNETKGASGP